MSLSRTKLNECLDWRWEDLPAARALSQAGSAPNAIGIYELGFMEGEGASAQFVPQYVGRAVGVSLRVRLTQHQRASHNLRVRSNAHRLWFRCRVVNTAALASYIEAVSIVALEYPFNRRNEWTQHWVLET